MKKLGGADILIKSLIEEGVDIIFGYPGGASLPFYDALPSYQAKIRHILVRHEQAASLAADGYARASGKVGVCTATSGPGATNLITGIANAYMDSIPIVAITGQVPSFLIGTDAFQEIDITGIALPITKQNYIIEDVHEIPRIIKEAFYIARSGRPGPVLIDFPKDIAAKEFKQPYDYQKISINLPGYSLPKEADQKSVKDSILLIKSAKKPLAIIGHGVELSDSFSETKKFIEKFDIPFISTILANGALPATHKNNFGIIGMHGMKYSNQAVCDADLIIAIGIRFDDRITGKTDLFAKNAKIIHFEIDPAEINKIIPAQVVIHGNIKNTLPQVTKSCDPLTHQKWQSYLLKLKDKYSFQKVEKLNKYHDSEHIHHGELLRDIYKVTQGKALVVTDVGQNQMLAWQYYQQNETRKWLTSGGLGAMGYGLPAAMGAKLAKPNSDVWLIVGDGGMQMNIQELMTLVQDKINIKICIFNNSYLGMVRQWQELFYDQNYSEVEFLNPDYKKIAEAYGIKGFTAKTIEEAKKINREICKLNEPIVVDYKIQKMGNVFPMVPAGASLEETRIN